MKKVVSEKDLEAFILLHSYTEEAALSAASFESPVDLLNSSQWAYVDALELWFKRDVSKLGGMPLIIANLLFGEEVYHGET